MGDALPEDEEGDVLSIPFISLTLLEILLLRKGTKGRCSVYSVLLATDKIGS